MMSFLLWVVAFFSCALVIRSSLFKGNYFSLKSLKLSNTYNNILTLCFVHSITIVASSFFYRFRINGDLEYSIIFLFFSLVLLSAAIYLYLDFLSNDSKHFKNISGLLIKLSWVVVSVGSYLFSRHIFMNMSDIPYDQVVTKTSVIGYAFLLYSFIYVYLSILPIIWLGHLQKNNKINGGIRVYSSYVVFIPCICLWVTSSSIYSINILGFMKSIFSVTIPLDSRVNFFCHDEYSRSVLLSNARYIRVGDSDYRVAIPTKYEYKFLRLKCTNYPPYYSLNPVVIDSNFKYTKVEQSFYNLITDIEAISIKK